MKYKVLEPPGGALGDHKMEKNRINSVKFGSIFTVCGNAYKTNGFLMILGAPGGENVSPGADFGAPGALTGGQEPLIFLVIIDDFVKASDF